MKQELLEHLIRLCVREVIEQNPKICINEALDAYFTIFNKLNPAIVDYLKSSCEGAEFYFDPKNPSKLRVRSVYSDSFNHAIKDTQDILKKNGYQFSIHQSLEESDENKTDDPKDDGDTKGAPAPPADGQGTGDQPEIPKKEPTDPVGAQTNADENPTDEPEVPAPTDLKGVILINPRDKSKLQKVPLKATSDDASLERNLHRLAATLAGSNVKISISTQRMVKDALKNPNSSAYLYLGKYDPNSDEIFLMADKSLQIAKDSSVSPAELSGTPVSYVAPTDFNPVTASPDEFAQRMKYGAQTPTYTVNEDFKRVVKKMVCEILDRK